MNILNTVYFVDFKEGILERKVTFCENESKNELIDKFFGKRAHKAYDFKQEPKKVDYTNTNKVLGI